MYLPSGREKKNKRTIADAFTTDTTQCGEDIRVWVRTVWNCYIDAKLSLEIVTLKWSHLLIPREKKILILNYRSIDHVRTKLSFVVITLKVLHRESNYYSKLHVRTKRWPVVIELKRDDVLILSRSITILSLVKGNVACFRTKCLRKEVFYILKEGAASSTGQYYEGDPPAAGQLTENA